VVDFTPSNFWRKYSVPQKQPEATTTDSSGVLGSMGSIVFEVSTNLGVELRLQLNAKRATAANTKTDKEII
jgi:hypothetical protein